MNQRQAVTARLLLRGVRNRRTRSSRTSITPTLACLFMPHINVMHYPALLLRIGSVAIGHRVS